MAFRDGSRQETFVPDPEVGYALSPSFRRRLPGGAGKISHRPIPGQTRLGYRTSRSTPGDAGRRRAAWT